MLFRNSEGRVMGMRAQTRAADVGQPFSDTNPLRYRLQQGQARSGANVNAEAVLGLATVLECIRQPAQLIGTLDWASWDWTQPAVPALDTASPLADLFNFPGFGSKFDLFQDISASIDGWGGALIQKIKGTTRKDKGRVIALRMVDPDMWKVDWDKDTGERIFKVKVAEKTSNGRWKKTEVTWSPADAHYIRGFTPKGFLAGIVPWDIFKNSLGNALAIEEFASNWWNNQGLISTYISHPEKLSPTQAEEILDIYEETHAGLANAGRPALLSGGAKLEELKLTVADMQLTESRNWIVDDICRMMNWAPELVTQATGSGLRYDAEQIVLKMQKIYLQPRTRRIRDSFNTDPDLFKGNKFWLDVRFDPIEAVSAATRADANLSNRQAGVVTANELRVPMGLPPHEDGDELQLTPVGGAPNEGDTPPKKGKKGSTSGSDDQGSPGAADETG
jgi:HK97 family phage portal protein